VLSTHNKLIHSNKKEEKKANEVVHITCDELTFLGVFVSNSQATSSLSLLLISLCRHIFLLPARFRHCFFASSRRWLLIVAQLQSVDGNQTKNFNLNSNFIVSFSASLLDPFILRRTSFRSASARCSLINFHRISTLLLPFLHFTKDFIRRLAVRLRLFVESHFTDYNVSDFSFKKQGERHSGKRRWGVLSLKRAQILRRTSDKFNKITKFNVACSSFEYISYWMR